MQVPSLPPSPKKKIENMHYENQGFFSVSTINRKIDIDQLFAIRNLDNYLRQVVNTISFQLKTWVN